MSQAADYTVDNSTGANVRIDLNAIFGAIATNNSAGSDNGSIQNLGFFADTSLQKLRLKEATGNNFVNLRGFDGSLPLPDGTASSPSLFFNDDTNTGIFSSAADTFDIATAGVARLQLDASETTFNEGGADTDFRIEGDADTRLFFLEAGTDRIGVGVDTAPLSKLHVQDVEGTTLTLGNTAAAASDGDYLSGIDFHIKDNNDSTGATCASIRTFADQNHTASAKGTALAFFTVDDDTTVLDERLRITENGNIKIGENNSLDVAFSLVGNGNGIMISRLVSGVPTNGQVLGDIGFCGASSNQAMSSSDGLIRCQAAADHSGTSAATDLLFFTKPTTTGPGSAPSERVRILSSGGITFNGDTSSDNALDDYEEGTFTPTFLNLDVPGHVTVDHYSYTKIGRLVHIEFQFTVSSSINDASGFRFTLPFGTLGDRNIRIGCLSNRADSGAVSFTFLHDVGGANIKAIRESGGFTGLNYNHFTGCVLVGGGTYETDA